MACNPIGTNYAVGTTFGSGLGQKHVSGEGISQSSFCCKCGLDTDKFESVGCKNNKQCLSVQPPSTFKKLCTGAASLLVPGVGQAVNGQYGKALGFFAGAVLSVPVAMACLLAAPLAATVPVALIGTAACVNRYSSLR